MCWGAVCFGRYCVCTLGTEIEISPPKKPWVVMYRVRLYPGVFSGGCLIFLSRGLHPMIPFNNNPCPQVVFG